MSEVPDPKIEEPPDAIVRAGSSRAVLCEGGCSSRVERMIGIDPVPECLQLAAAYGARTVAAASIDEVGG